MNSFVRPYGFVAFSGKSSVMGTVWGSPYTVALLLKTIFAERARGRVRRRGEAGRRGILKRRASREGGSGAEGPRRRLGWAASGERGPPAADRRACLHPYFPISSRRMRVPVMLLS